MSKLKNTLKETKEENKPLTAEEKESANVQNVANMISKILSDNKLMIVPVVQIIGGQVSSKVEIMPQPKEEKIVTPTK